MERQPIMEGRFMNMYLAPLPAKQVAKPKVAREPKPAKVTGSGDAGEPAMAAALKAAGVEVALDRRLRLKPRLHLRLRRLKRRPRKASITARSRYDTERS